MKHAQPTSPKENPQDSWNPAWPDEDKKLDMWIEVIDKILAERGIPIPGPKK